MMSQSDYLTHLIKDLAPLEIFDFYDGPKFYSCQDRVGQIFLVYWIDENSEYNSWLYIRVSQERYLSLKNGIISIASVLSNPEEGIAFIVNNYGANFSVEQIPSKQISPEWLPSVDDYLNLNSSALPKKILSAVEISQRSNRHVFDLAFDQISNSYEMGCGKLGKLLDSFQNIIYALSCSPNLDIRRVPEHIKFNNEVLVTGLFESSFGIRLQSKSGELFPNDSTEILAFLLSILESPDDLSNNLLFFNILARSRFKYFLQLLVDAEVSIKSDWASPSGKNLQSRTSFIQIKRALTKLEEAEDATKNTVTRFASLVGVDIESDFFALKLEENEIIKGKLSKAISTRHFDVPSKIIATIEETCIIDPLTEREKWSYSLIDFKKQT